MRINTSKSIEAAGSVHARFGSWEAAKAAADFENGKFVIRRPAGSVRSAAKDHPAVK